MPQNADEVLRAVSVADVEQRARDVMVDQWGVEEAKLTREALLGRDLGVDSLDLVEFVMGAEDEFGIEIPDDEIDGRLLDQTVGAALDVVLKHALPF